MSSPYLPARLSEWFLIDHIDVHRRHAFTPSLSLVNRLANETHRA